MRNTCFTYLLKISLLSVVFAAGALPSWAQSGRGGIQGTITDNTTKEGLMQATVQVAGTTQGTLSDLDGNYALQGLAPGTHTLVFMYGGYRTDTIANVEVSAGKFTQLDIRMVDTNYEITETIEVTAERVALTNNVALISDMRTSNLVETGISAQQRVQQHRNGLACRRTLLQRRYGHCLLGRGFWL